MRMNKTKVGRRLAVTVAAAALGFTSLGCPGESGTTATPATEGTTAEATPATAAVVMAPEGPIKRYTKRWPTKNWREWPTMRDTSPARSKPTKAPADLLEMKGDVERGREVINNRKKGGGCVACHIIPGFPLPGDVGPSLVNHAKTSGRTREWLLNYVWDPRIEKPNTVMPPWGTNGVLTKQEIADAVAFLLTLNKTENPTGLDDPAARPRPTQTRDNLDPTVNPAVFAFDDAEDLHGLKGSKKACSGCHADPEKAYKGASTKYPLWSKEQGKIIGLEQFIAAHAEKESGHNWPIQSDENLAMSVWVRQFSNGMPIKVDTTSPEAAKAMQRAEKYMSKRIGQLDFACSDCHGLSANKWIRGQFLGGEKGQIPHFPVWRTSRSLIWDIRKRFQWCNVRVRANDLEADSAEYGDIELYLTAQSNGLPVSGPGIRH